MSLGVAALASDLAHGSSMSFPFASWPAYAAHASCVLRPDIKAVTVQRSSLPTPS